MENSDPKNNPGQKTVKRVIKKRIISDASGAYGYGGYGGYMAEGMATAAMATAAEITPAAELRNAQIEPSAII